MIGQIILPGCATMKQKIGTVRKNRARQNITVLLLTMGMFADVYAEESAVKFGGPDAVENQIEEDSREKKAVIEQRAAQTWFDWKKGMQEKHGLSLGLDYTGVYFNADSSLDKDTASSGIFRFFGSWDLVGKGTKNTGAFVWKVEHRHKYGDVAPSEFGLGHLGYVGLFEASFSDQGTRWTNLYWRQRFNDGKVTLVGGFLDATDYLDVFVLGSPWTGFANFAFSTGTYTMFIPNDVTLGVAAGAMLSDKMYLIGGLTNAYSDPTEPFDGIDTFIDDNEYFTSIELGWTPSHDRIYFDNTHITLWHVDESEKAGAQEGWGAAFSYVSFINDKLMPFVRGGYADDGGTLMQKSLSVGLGYQEVAGRDLLGVGFNWGEPNETTFTTGLDNQYTMELFYRFQLAQQFAITPNIEYLKNPALNPDESQIWVFGLRARLAI